MFENDFNAVIPGCTRVSELPAERVLGAAGEGGQSQDHERSHQQRQATQWGLCAHQPLPPSCHLGARPFPGRITLSSTSHCHLLFGPNPRFTHAFSHPATCMKTLFLLSGCLRDPSFASAMTPPPSPHPATTPFLFR
jgi:hypothetical protein